ncbi:MAG: hypothetical protein R3275_02290 [Saprospiraceae bacterium]|nr:hypothetical protein [Saprospiraceae bacterium]
MRCIFLMAFLCSITLIKGHPSYGIAVDHNRNIYFADILHNGRGSIWKLTHHGELHLVLKDFHSHNLTLDTAGNIITGQGEGQHTFLRLCKSGERDTIFDTRDPELFTGDISGYDRWGNAYFVHEDQLWKVNPNGPPLRVSDERITWPRSIYVDDEGLVYITDIGEANGRLIRMDPGNGEHEVLASDLITELGRPLDKHNDILGGVTKGCDDLTYVTEYAGRRVIQIDHSGSARTFYRSSGEWIPTGLDFFSGDAYIMEYRFGKTGMMGPQIVKVTESGTRSIIFNFEGYSSYDEVPSRQVDRFGLSGVTLLLMILLINCISVLTLGSVIRRDLP